MQKSAKEMSHQAIVEAAWSMARNEGIAGLTMTKIAKAASLTRQAVYWHFQSRTNLLFEVAQFNDRQLEGADVLFNGLPDVSGVESLVAMLKVWLNSLPTAGPLLLALYSASLTDDDARDALQARMKDLRDTIEKVFLKRIEAEGHVKDGTDIVEAACFIYMLASPPSWQQITQCLGWNHDFFVGYVIDKVLELYVKPEFRVTVNR